MKFGRTLASRIVPGWRYVAYGTLKQSLKEVSVAETGAFRKALLRELVEVDEFFHHLEVQLEEMCISRQDLVVAATHVLAEGEVTEERTLKFEPCLRLTRDLRAFAVINYLAVLKILKKHDKVVTRFGSSSMDDGLVASSMVRRRLFECSFCIRLCGSKLFTGTAKLLDSTEHLKMSTSSLHDTQCPVCVEASMDMATLGCGHRFCWKCLSDCVAHGIGKCPLCRIAQSLEPTDLVIDSVLGCFAQQYYPANAVPVPECLDIKVMTWNVCSLTFPLAVHPFTFAIGLLFGYFWYDKERDAPMNTQGRAAQAHFNRQAEYIRSSGADVVMLQEVLSTSVVHAFQRRLGGEYDFCYAVRPPTLVANILHLGLILTLAVVQAVLLEFALWMLWHCSSTDACSLLARWLALVAILAVRLRDSVPVQFLTGSVAGQLVVLRRRACSALASPSPSPLRAAFHGFDEDFAAPSEEREGTDSSYASVVKPSTFSSSEPRAHTPAWLKLFFGARPRGILHVNLPLNGSRKGGYIAVMNTHLPHGTDNDALLRRLGRLTAEISQQACAVVLAGDFNPCPEVPILTQFDPLLRAGNALTNAPGQEHCTWDLEQPLTRVGDNNPRTMQLDFVFVQSQLAAPATTTSEPGRLQSKSASSGLEVVGTELVNCKSFFVPGAPLSDHYGLASDIRLGAF